MEIRKLELATFPKTAPHHRKVSAHRPPLRSRKPPFPTTTLTPRIFRIVLCDGLSSPNHIQHIFGRISFVLSSFRHSRVSSPYSVLNALLSNGFYRFPFARLWVLQSIWQFLMSVAPPFDHAVTWSASISLNFQIRFAFAA